MFQFVYSQVETNKVFLRDTTIISPFSILLFGGSINVQHQVFIMDQIIIIDVTCDQLIFSQCQLHNLYTQ